MKKLILLALLSITTTISFAQSFISQYGDTVIANYSGPGNINVENRIKCATPNDSVALKWRITDYDIPTDWTFVGMCDNNTCWPSTALAGNFYVSNMYNDTYEDFHAIFNADMASTGSMAWIKVQAIDTASHSYTRTFVFIATKNVNGVSNVVKADGDIALYPNPAKSNLNVVFDASLNVRNIAVYNMIGKPVKVFKVTGNSAKLDINDIPAGIYFLRLVNSNGQIVATRKFTHQ